MSVSEPLDRAMQQLAETIDGIDTNIGGQLDERPAVDTKTSSTTRNCKLTRTLGFAADFHSLYFTTKFLFILIII